MSTNKIIQLNEGMIKQELKDLVRTSVEETINGLLDEEVKALTGRQINLRKTIDGTPFAVSSSFLSTKRSHPLPERIALTVTFVCAYPND